MNEHDMTELTQGYSAFLDKATTYFAENEEGTFYNQDDYFIAVRDLKSDTVVTYEFIEGIHNYSADIKLKREEMGTIE